jgi:uncharacterized protein (DUF2141 family)
MTKRQIESGLPYLKVTGSEVNLTIENPKAEGYTLDRNVAKMRIVKGRIYVNVFDKADGWYKPSKEVEVADVRAAVKMVQEAMRRGKIEEGKIAQ